MLLRFFLNPETQAYLRGLAEETGESTNAIRVELNRLTKAGLLESHKSGRTKQYRANTKHPLYPELHNLVKKNIGIEQVAETIIAQLGKVETAFIIGDYAKGIDSGIIDLVIVGDIDKPFLQFLLEKTEALIKRKIRILVFNQDEYDAFKEKLNTKQALVMIGETGLEKLTQ